MLMWRIDVAHNSRNTRPRFPGLHSGLAEYKYPSACRVVNPIPRILAPYPILRARYHTTHVLKHQELA
jgi:hypothetical protein